MIAANGHPEGAGQPAVIEEVPHPAADTAGPAGVTTGLPPPGQALGPDVAEADLTAEPHPDTWVDDPQPPAMDARRTWQEPPPSLPWRADRQRADDLLWNHAEIATKTMKSNVVMNNVARIVFYLAAIVLLGVAVYYLSVLHRQDAPDAAEYIRISVVFLGSVACVVVALIIQSRNSKELSRYFDQVGRLRRESLAADSRSRALVQVLEETLLNAKQAFAVQLWISRVLFFVGLALFAVFLVALAFFRENIPDRKSVV